MTPRIFYLKAKSIIWYKLVIFLREKKIYPYIYRSYWHYLFSKSVQKENMTCYYTAQPNPGAGIGHQMANWIAGFWFACQFEVKFAHIPFSTQTWEDFLGFGESELTVDDLKLKGFSIRKLPLFNEHNPVEVELTKAIIKSYSGMKVVFIAEQDQGLKDQFLLRDVLKNKFNNSPARKIDKIVYDSSHFNIAVHVRRTVIIEGKIIHENKEIQALRWLNNNYYEKVLMQVLDNIKVLKPINIYIFSTGRAEEFAEFSKYGNVHFCSEMDEYASFLHLVKADLLITSKSSFSYKPALMNDGIKICPRNFWHGYPDAKDWILVENDGTFDVSKLNDCL